MHTLPTRRAVVELPTRPSRHRSRIERLMQTSPMRATVAFLIPSILVAIQLVYIQRAYTSQQRFRKVWDSLEPIVISAQSGGWTQETESQAGALLESFQVLAAEFIEKTRAVMAVFLVTCVLTFVVSSLVLLLSWFHDSLNLGLVDIPSFRYHSRVCPSCTNHPLATLSRVLGRGSCSTHLCSNSWRLH